MRNWVCFFVGMLLALGPVGSVTAQVDPDSVRIWTLQLRSGSLEEKVSAAGYLHAAGPRGLPADAQDAMVEELGRINALLMSSAAVPGAAVLGPETFGEYYLDLTLSVANFGTPTASRALVRSVGVGRGVRQMVARQGDAVIPELAEMIERGHHAGDALETLALAWFWSDSTGAELTPASRAVIAREMMGAASTSDYPLARSAASALELLGDPAFLPLAQGMQARAMTADLRLLAGALRREAIPKLAAAAQRMSPSELSARVVRAAAAVCEGAARGPRQGSCGSIQNELRTAREHIIADRVQPARNVLMAAIQRAEQAVSTGALSSLDSELLAGGARMLLERISTQQ